MKILRFKTNLNCANCVKKVSPFLNEIFEIKWSVDTTNADKILTVEAENPDSGEVINAVEDAGFDIEILENS